MEEHVHNRVATETNRLRKLSIEKMENSNFGRDLSDYTKKLELETNAMIDNGHKRRSTDPDEGQNFLRIFLEFSIVVSSSSYNFQFLLQIKFFVLTTFPFKSWIGNYRAHSR